MDYSYSYLIYGRTTDELPFDNQYIRIQDTVYLSHETSFQHGRWVTIMHIAEVSLLRRRTEVLPPIRSYLHKSCSIDPPSESIQNKF